MLLSLFGCAKQKTDTNLLQNDIVVVKLDEYNNERYESNFEDILIQTQSVTQADKKVNYHSRLELESVSVITYEGNVWYIWKDVSEEYAKMSNIVITTSIFGVPFGPIDGYENEQLRIGWNNQNRVLYVEVLSNKVKTFDGITLGDSKEKVIDILGDPYIEDDNQFRYQNIDFEMVGILFQFKSEIVTEVFLFGYI